MAEPIDILKKILGLKDYSCAEEEVLKCVLVGTIADFSSGDPELDDPENAAKWDEGYTIRAEFLRRLCIHPETERLVQPGGVVIKGAKISGVLDFTGALILHLLAMLGCAIEEGITLSLTEAKSISLEGSLLGPVLAAGLSVKGSVFLNGVKAKGEISLLSADIGGQLVCNDAAFENKKEESDAFSAEHLTVHQGLFLRGMTINGALNLLSAKVGTLVDDGKSWPSEEGNLLLDGFEYYSIAPGSPISAKERLKWLRLQPKSRKGKKIFFPQPYEQLARVLHRMGHEADAREILMAKQNDLRERGTLSKWGKLCNWVLGMTVGHGYQTWRAILISIALIFLGAGIFCHAANFAIMQPSKERVYMDAGYKATRKLPDEYPRFNPIIYSLDVFVPFVDLHQENYWLPDATRPKGWLFRLYFWAHIAFGWVFSTLAALSLAGVVRKDKL